MVSPLQKANDMISLMDLTQQKKEKNLKKKSSWHESITCEDECRLMIRARKVHTFMMVESWMGRGWFSSSSCFVIWLGSFLEPFYNMEFSLSCASTLMIRASAQTKPIHASSTICPAYSRRFFPNSYGDSQWCSVWLVRDLDSFI